MSFTEIHGLKLAENSFVQNLVVENLASDPVPVEAGRIWFNTIEKQYKASTLNEGGAVVVQVLGGKEQLDKFIADLASTAAGKGLSLVGYAGKVGTNGEFTVAAGTAVSALDAIVAGIDSTKQAITDLGTGSLTNIQNEVDATQVGAGLSATGAYVAGPGNYINTAASLKDADSKLDTALKGVSDALDAEAATRASQDALKVNKAGDAMTGELSMSDHRITNVANPTDDQDAVTKVYVDSAISGISWKQPVKAATTANITLSGLQTIDGIVMLDGDRVLVHKQTDKITNGIYAVNANAWVRTTDMDDVPDTEVEEGLAVFVEQGSTYGDCGFTLLGTDTVAPKGIQVGSDELDFVQFSGAGQVIAGAGISKNGNEIYLNMGAGIVELPSDEIGIDVHPTGGMFTTTDGITSSTLSSAQLAIKLDGTTLTKGANGLKITDTVLSGIADAIDVVANELDVTQTGAGLEVSGAYAPNTSANYIAAAASLKNADTLLDTAVKANEVAIQAEVTARGIAEAAIQAELDAVELGAGLGTNGVYVAPASNYIASSTSIKNATVILDTQLKAANDSLAQEIIDRTTAIAAVKSAVNGNTVTFESSVPATSHVITHALGSPFVTVALWVKQDDGSFKNDIAQITLTSNSSLTVDLTVAKNIRVVVTAPADI